MIGFRTFFILAFLVFTLPVPATEQQEQSDIHVQAQNKIRPHTMNKMADYYLDVDLDTARLYADSALLLASIDGDYKQVSDAWINIGNTYFFRGHLDSAMVYYEKSLQAIRLTTNMDEIAAALNRMGLIYEAKGNYDEAINFYIKAVSYFERSLNTKGLADVYNNIGIVNNHYKHHTTAKDFYQKSLNLYSLIEDKDGMGKTMNNLATLYTEQGQQDSALFYIRQARGLFRSINRPSEEATCLLNIAVLYIEENPDSVMPNLLLAEKSFAVTGNLTGQGSVDFYKGEYFLKKGETREAILYYKKALKNRQRVGNMQSTADNMEALAIAYEKNQEYDKAIRYFRQAQQIKDSIAEMDMQVRFQNLQVRYDSAKKDRDLILYKKQTQERHVTIIFLIIGISGLLIISFLFFYLFRTKARLLNSKQKYFSQQEEMNKLILEKQKAENKLLEEEIIKQKEVHRLENEKYHAEIEHKSRELLTSAMHIVNKNKILASIRDTLDNISLNADKEFRKKARTLCYDIDKNIHVDSDWDQFKMHFDAVNSDFFERLENEFPKLTKSDMKVCAYLKINLSTKEIAQIMNVSPAAVHKRFYRLRLKMSLEPNTNLTKFFMGF